MRKGSEDDIDTAVNPYMIRKIKFKQFMRKNNLKVQDGSKKMRSV